MALQTSGAISLSELQTEFGGTNPISISEYYKGGTNVEDGITYTNYTADLAGDYVPNVPASGVVKVSDFYEAGNVIVWNESTSPVKTGVSTTESTTFLASTYITGLNTGDEFAVCAHHLAATSWTHSNTARATLVCTKGTSSTITVPQYYDKQWRIEISYDGDDTVTIGGYYCCSGTSFPNGGVYLLAVTRI